MNSLSLTTTILFAAIFLLSLNYVYSDSNKDRSFININNPIPCIRRFNATHQIGCAKSDINTYTGIVYAVRNSSELDRLKKIVFNDNDVIVVTLPIFYPKIVDYYLNFRKKSGISGIVLIETSRSDYLNEVNPDSFSADSKRPNQKFDLYGNSDKNIEAIEWNDEDTNDYMFQKFDIPMYIITDENEAMKIFNDCYDKFNKQIFDLDETVLKIDSTDLLCGMELGLDMSGAISSKVCIRRESIQYTVEPNLFCDPLGGDNYYTFLSQKPSNDLPISIVSSRIDTFTMYEYYTPGANEPISSIIGLLSLAELLSKHRDNMVLKNVIFTLFDNEAFDYGGSSRFVNDLMENKFPTFTITNISNEATGTSSFKLDKSNIKTMIELNQLGSIGLNGNDNLYIHKDPISYSGSKSISSIIDNLAKNLTSYSKGLITSVNNTSQELAPSSIQSFLRLNLTLAGILITDHDTKYKNNYYHSVFDTPESMNISFPENMTEEEASNNPTGLSRKLQGLLTNIAQTIYFEGSGMKLNDTINQVTLNRLIYCFYKNTTCNFFKSMLTDNQWAAYNSLLQSNLPKNKLSFYTSVNNAQISGKWITQMLLKYFTRNEKFETLDSINCNKDSEDFKIIMKANNLSPTNINFVNGLCVVTSLYGVSSVSPAFNKYIDGILVDTNKFSAWTESSWNGKPIQMRLFMFTNKAFKISTLIFGIGTLIISFVVTLVISRLSNKWFKINFPEQIAEIIEQ